MKLINPTDGALNAAFAIEVAGWTRVDLGGGAHCWKHPRPSDGELSLYPLEDFVGSANAVLPWLEKRPDVEIHRLKSDGWQVSIMDIKRFLDREETGVIAEAWEDTFPRAAVIALLRAHGIAVEFTP